MPYSATCVSSRARSLLALVFVAAMTLAPAARAHQSSPIRLEFSQASVWDGALGTNAAVDPTSGARVGALARDIERKAARGQVTWPGVGHSTFYTVGSRQALRPVKLDTGSWGGALADVFRAGVPIPVGARAGLGPDAHMVIYQPSTDRMWELYQAHLRPNGWHASWGGAQEALSQSPGYYTNRSWSGLAGDDGFSWGSTASSLPEGAGLVRIDELRAGGIAHALAVDVANPCRGMFAFPAQRTDGLDRARHTCMPEGARLRIDPRIDLSKLHLTPVGRMLAEAAQRYGMVVRDRTFGTFQFDMEQPHGTGPDPYRGKGGLYRGQPPWVILKHFPWRSLQLMHMSVCTSAPCRA